MTFILVVVGLLSLSILQACSQPSDIGGGRFPKILDLFQGLKIGSSQWLSRGNLDF